MNINLKVQCIKRNTILNGILTYFLLVFVPLLSLLCLGLELMKVRASEEGMEICSNPEKIIKSYCQKL